MQSQMIGLQSSLDRILNHLQNQQPLYPPTPSSTFGPGRSAGGAGGPSPDAFFPNTPGGGGGGNANAASGSTQPKKKFPPLPGFAPPPHKYATYGIVPSTAPSSDDESEDTLPRATLNAPIEALQGLANAAAEAAAAPIDSPP